MASKILIIGCGYIGLPLARLFREQGHEVAGWVHSAESAAALDAQIFNRIIVGSVGSEEVWQTIREKYDAIIHCASSGRGGVEAYEEVFLRGVTLMNEHQKEARRLFVSSTSVYGQTQGEIVTEESQAEPGGETGRILREAEKVAVEAGAMVVRSAGIYGPGRSVLWEKFKRGEAVIEGDGMRWINQIYQSDLVAAVAYLMEKGKPGQIYNASDDAPVTQANFYAWCADFLGKPMPPHGPVNVNRKRGLTNKRVSNAKLRALGWRPEHPGFREGLATLD